MNAPLLDGGYVSQKGNDLLLSVRERIQKTERCEPSKVTDDREDRHALEQCLPYDGLLEHVARHHLVCESELAHELCCRSSILCALYRLVSLDDSREVRNG